MQSAAFALMHFAVERKRLVIPRKLVRPGEISASPSCVSLLMSSFLVFGGKEWVMKQIAQETGAILSLHDCACTEKNFRCGVRIFCIGDERVKLVTAYGPSDSLR